jgi:hypothetical protein
MEEELKVNTEIMSDEEYHNFISTLMVSGYAYYAHTRKGTVDITEDTSNVLFATLAATIKYQDDLDLIDLLCAFFKEIDRLE